MTSPYTYLIEDHTRIEVVWAKDIDHAIRLIQARMEPDKYAIICSFGGSDKVEIGKRAVN